MATLDEDGARPPLDELGRDLPHRLLILDRSPDHHRCLIEIRGHQGRKGEEFGQDRALCLSIEEASARSSDHHRIEDIVLQPEIPDRPGHGRDEFIGREHPSLRGRGLQICCDDLYLFIDHLWWDRMDPSHTECVLCSECSYRGGAEDTESLKGLYIGLYPSTATTIATSYR